MKIPELYNNYLNPIASLKRGSIKQKIPALIRIEILQNVNQNSMIQFLIPSIESPSIENIFASFTVKIMKLCREDITFCPLFV